MDMITDSEQGKKFLAGAKAHMVFINSNRMRDIIWRKPDDTLWRERHFRDTELVHYSLESIDWRALEVFSQGEIDKAIPRHEILYSEL